MNGTGDLSWYLGCAFERGKMGEFMKMTQTAFADLLVDILIYSIRPRLPRP